MNTDWFTYQRQKNEATYTDYCEHKDRMCYLGDDEKFYISCNSCGAEAVWNHKGYNQPLKKTKWPLKISN